MIGRVFARLVFLMVFTLTLSVVDTSPAWAQQNPANKGEETAQLTGPRKQLATIIFAGLAGAILGLSTLSFYGRPQDHLQNIALGFAVGVIGGTSWATFKAATSPEEFYGTTAAPFDGQPDLSYDHSRANMQDIQMAQHFTFKPVQMRWTF